MARRLRIQYEGAVYHVVNRGNYRRDLFETAGAAAAFETAVEETCSKFQWRLHAFGLLPNHFHGAITIRTPNLSEGMQWLQATFALRFNGFRKEHGHLFQGRFYAGLIEDAAALGRVVDYIHLNPVRAGLVQPEQVDGFRWSSLRRLVRGGRWSSLSPGEWLTAKGYSDDADGWAAYVRQLVTMGRDPALRKEADMENAWAIGTNAWRRGLAEEYSLMALDPGLTGEEVRALRSAEYSRLLTGLLRAGGITERDIAEAKPGAAWKVPIAVALREKAVPYPWIATELRMKSAATVRTRVWRARKFDNLTP